MKEPYSSIPKQVGDWLAQESDRFYDRKTLYNYIDGGAELYLTYEFQEAFIRRFAKAGDPDMEIVLDVYDMGSSEEAFGIFSCEREDKSIGVGQGSEYGGGLLRFWKDRYFVSLVALGDEDEAKPVMMEVARAVAGAIPATGAQPALIGSLPQDGLVAEEIRYFHTMQCLNNQFFMSSENILELGRDTDGLLTLYEREEEKGYLALIRYTDEGKAVSAYQSFLKATLGEADAASGAAPMANGRWTLSRSTGPYVVVVLDAPSREWGERLLSEVSPGEE